MFILKSQSISSINSSLYLLTALSIRTYFDGRKFGIYSIKEIKYVPCKLLYVYIEYCLRELGNVDVLAS